MKNRKLVKCESCGTTMIRLKALDSWYSGGRSKLGNVFDIESMAWWCPKPECVSEAVKGQPWLDG